MTDSPPRPSAHCPACGAVRSGPRCAACGFESSPPSSTVDPLIGRTIADRYEITKLINVGGMGRVYRGMQRSLGREVAIKFIHPHLAASDLSIQRFLTEARAASRLNHPHVISIFDFGRTADADGGLLFLVMELLDGPDLVSVLRDEGPLPFQRVAMILGQTLEALGEAHRLGITHRDIKPDNIMLMPRRKGRDHVKVIDFGTARLMQGAVRITQAGNTCGTPAYMAPEQGSGGAIGPWTDLYSVGVMMFEMLTGALPFAGSTAISVLLQHMTAARPDPRAAAPDREIPDSLAEICLQAIDVDPTRRFETAEDFGEALALAMTSGTGATRGSFRWTTDSFLSRSPSKSSTPPRSTAGGRDDVETLPEMRHSRRAPTPPPDTPVPDTEPTEDPNFLGRDRDFAWALELIAKADRPPALAFWGRAGVGRTHLLNEITAAGEYQGALVIRIPLAPEPRCIIGYSGLRAMITRLSGLPANELLAGRLTGATNVEIARGLRAIFAEAPGRPPAGPTALRAEAGAALRWAIRRALDRAEKGRAMLALDDLERLDGASLLALDDVITGEPIRGFMALVTAEQSPGGAFSSRAPSRTLRGLTRAQAMVMLASRREGANLARPGDDIEPLYVEQIARLKPTYEQAAPHDLRDLAAWRVQGLPPPHRRLLQVVAVMGGGPIEQMKSVLQRSFPAGPRAASHTDEIDDAIQPLVDGGFLVMSERGLVLTHAILGRAAIATAPGGAVAEMHEATADVIAEQRGSVELRAHHAIRGKLDFQSFVLVEETAKLRTAHGDRPGAIAAFWEALGAARSQLMRGELELAPTAFTIFGRKLAAALTDDGRLDEARGILEEVLDIAAPMDANRAHVLEQLASIAERRGQRDEAERRHHQAIEAAERCGDIDMVEGLRSLFGGPIGRSPRKTR